MGFLPERLLAAHVAGGDGRGGSVDVEIVDWVQWGTLRAAGEP